MVHPRLDIDKYIADVLLDEVGTPQLSFAQTKPFFNLSPCRFDCTGEVMANTICQTEIPSCCQKKDIFATTFQSVRSCCHHRARTLSHYCRQARSMHAYLNSPLLMSPSSLLQISLSLNRTLLLVFLGLVVSGADSGHYSSYTSGRLTARTPPGLPAKCETFAIVGRS